MPEQKNDPVLETGELKLTVTVLKTGEFKVEFTGLWLPPIVKRSQQAITNSYRFYRDEMVKSLNRAKRKEKARVDALKVAEREKKAEAIRKAEEVKKITQNNQTLKKDLKTCQT